VESLTYKDWAVTTIYYTAIHYIEAVFAQDIDIQHTESQIVRYPRLSMHSIREELVRNHYSGAWRALRKLHEQSNIARYHNFRGKVVVQVPVQDYFSDTDVRNFFTQDLATIKQVIGVS